MDPFALSGMFGCNELREYLSEEDLKQITRTEHLSSVTVLETQVDAVNHSLGPLGKRLPNVVEVRFNGSHFNSLRDLGTSLGSIRILWLSRCGVEQLGGTFAVPLLEELYLSYNKVKDLSPLASLRHLRTLDLESNEVASVDNLPFLTPCERLHTLTLTGNPVASEPGYREELLSALPALEYLDDEPVSGSGEVSPACSSGGRRPAAAKADVADVILARLDKEAELAAAERGELPTRRRSSFLAGLIAREMAGLPAPRQATEAERLADEVRAVEAAVKEARFTDPCQNMLIDDLSDDERDVDYEALTDDAYTGD
eukprot:gene17761-27345_t